MVFEQKARDRAQTHAHTIQVLMRVLGGVRHAIIFLSLTAQYSITHVLNLTV